MESQHCHCLLVLTCGLALSAGFPTDASRQLQEIGETETVANAFELINAIVS